MKYPYPELITPKSYPERLAQLGYDPYRLVPDSFPARPYLLATRQQVKMVRARIKQGSWHKPAFEHIRKLAAGPAPDLASAPVSAQTMLAQSGYALRNSIVAHLAGERACRDAALRVLRELARIYPDLPVIPGMGRLPAGEDFRDASFIMQVAKAYDFLAADGLAPADEALFRRLLESTAAASNAGAHLHCGNHHTGVLAGRLAAALALQDRQGIHDVLYGYFTDTRWAYGLIHQLRHDILGDGLQWERSISYHSYTLTAFVEMLDLLLNVGVDLWRTPLPPLWQNDGFDQHRDYGLRADEAKSFKATFEILLYLAFPNGQFSMIGDSNFGAIQGIAQACGTLFERAWQVYRDPRFAWLIRRVETEAPDFVRSVPGIPTSLLYPAEYACLNLFRVERMALPKGAFDLSRATRISVAGEHCKGCSSFNVYGATLLRSNGDSLTAPAAYLFWGPHSAGHQDPGPLHLELYGGGSIRTPAPRADQWAFNDSLYLAWPRTTLAHNTVTVDGKPAFPYDEPTESMWEADTWRDGVSAGERVCFSPDSSRFKVVRARNARVYPGVTLDRTVIVTPRLAIDVFRCHSSAMHVFDWAMHVVGTPSGFGGLPKAPPLKGRGYDQLKDIRRLPVSRNALELAWEAPEGMTRAALRTPGHATFFLGRDPESSYRAMGQYQPAGIRHALIVRVRGREALFVSAWTFDGTPVRLARLAGAARKDLRIHTTAGQQLVAWWIPMADEAPIRAMSIRQLKPHA